MTFDHYTIRHVRMDDLQAYFNLIENNRKQLEPFFAGTVALTKTVEDTRTHLEEVLEKAGKLQYFPFVVIDNTNGQLIGSIQVKNLDWSIPKAELGYYIDARYQGKGITSRAVAKIIDYCFDTLRINKLLIRTYQENTGSMRVAEKNGFHVEGVIRRDYKTTDGTIVDLIYYGLLR